jgi:hypothetical protein
MLGHLEDGGQGGMRRDAPETIEAPVVRLGKGSRTK